ncbi:hypothetical protein AAK967_08990 [Atopobiaceae bacterium 24-176]
MKKRAFVLSAALCCALALAGCGAQGTDRWENPESGRLGKDATGQQENKYSDDLNNMSEVKSFWLTIDIPDSWDQQDDGNGQYTFVPSVGGLAMLTNQGNVDFTGDDGRPEVDVLLDTLEEGGVTRVTGNVEKGKQGQAVTYTAPISRSQDGTEYSGYAHFILSGHGLYMLTACVPTEDFQSGYDDVLVKIMDSMSIASEANNPPLGKESSSGKKGSASNSSENPSEQSTSQPKDPASYEQIPWSDLARTPDSYAGKSISISGRVLQVIEDDEINQLRVATSGDYDDVVLVGYVPSIMGGTRILEDDHITVLGTYLGTITYETTMGASKTIPGVYADSIHIE